MAERPGSAALVWGQIRYQNKIFWRTPISAFFTLVFPLMFLIVFGLIIGSEDIEGTGLTVAQFYAPALAVFGAVSATYTNLAISTAIARDEGILKRVRGTPLPAWCYIAGRVGSAIYMAFLSVLIMLVAGIVFYGLKIYAESVPALILTFLVGVGTFAVLGLLLAGLSPSGTATSRPWPTPRCCLWRSSPTSSSSPATTPRRGSPAWPTSFRCGTSPRLSSTGSIRCSSPPRTGLSTTSTGPTWA